MAEVNEEILRKQVMISQFCNQVGCSQDQATKILQTARWQLEVSGSSPSGWAVYRLCLSTSIRYFNTHRCLPSVGSIYAFLSRPLAGSPSRTA